MANRDEQFDEKFLRKLDYLYIMSKKIMAGGALNHKKPSPAPINALQKTISSPLPAINGNCK